MATSGVSTFDSARDAILLAALRMVGGIPAFGTAAAYATEITNAALALEMIVKGLQGNSVFLWSTEWTTQPIVASSLKVGTDALNYRCVRAHTSAAGNCPITGTDWRTYWQLTSTAGSAWASGQSYVSAGDFAPNADTLHIEKAFVRDSSGNDSPVRIIRESDYMDLPDKYTETTYPDCLYLDVRLTPRVYLWPQPSGTGPDCVLHYLRVRKLEDYSEATKTSDFPALWIRPLKYLLAADLGEEFGMSDQWLVRTELKAQQLLKEAKQSNCEKTDQNHVAPAHNPEN